jgi:RNA polymerase sigma factor (sigma-70 family)
LPPIADECALLCRLAQDDYDAFDAIYRLYFYAIYRNAFKMTREAELAEDVLQEVFLTLWEKRNTIDTSRSVGGWLFVICFNKSVNLLRKKLRAEQAYQQLQQPEEEQNEVSDYDLQWQILEDAITQLSPQKRKVFELCKLQGKSYEETAAALRISKHTVKEYLSSSVSSIKDYVQHQSESSVAATTGLFLFVML